MLEFQVQVQMAIIPVLALLLVLFSIGIALLWKRGKTVEGIASNQKIRKKGIFA